MRGIVHALGFDPEKYIAQIVRGPYPGLCIRELDGRPVQFFTRAELKKLETNPGFIARFEEEVGKQRPDIGAFVKE